MPLRFTASARLRPPSSFVSQLPFSRKKSERFSRVRFARVSVIGISITCGFSIVPVISCVAMTLPVRA